MDIASCVKFWDGSTFMRSKCYSTMDKERKRCVIIVLAPTPMENRNRCNTQNINGFGSPGFWGVTMRCRKESRYISLRSRF